MTFYPTRISNHILVEKNPATGDKRYRPEIGDGVFADEFFPTKTLALAYRKKVLSENKDALLKEMGYAS